MFIKKKPLLKMWKKKFPTPFNSFIQKATNLKMNKHIIFQILKHRWATKSFLSHFIWREQNIFLPHIQNDLSWQHDSFEKLKITIHSADFTNIFLKINWKGEIVKETISYLQLLTANRHRLLALIKYCGLPLLFFSFFRNSKKN